MLMAGLEVVEVDCRRFVTLDHDTLIPAITALAALVPVLRTPG